MATVMVTGANRGIGLGLVKHYLSQGDRVIAACRDTSAASLQELKDSENLQVVQLDVGDNQSIDQAAKVLQGQAIDLLINNAGVGGGPKQGLQDVEIEKWMEVLRINTMSPLYVTRAFIPNLKQAKNPKVMVISSQLGAISYPSLSLYIYESSKAAVNKVVKGLAKDLKADGIAVFVFHPGWVKTDMGGPNAAITVDQSASGLAATVAKLSIDNTGSFWQWDGTEHAW